MRGAPEKTEEKLFRNAFIRVLKDLAKVVNCCSRVGASNEHQTFISAQLKPKSHIQDPFGKSETLYQAYLASLLSFTGSLNRVDDSEVFPVACLRHSFMCGPSSLLHLTYIKMR